MECGEEEEDLTQRRQGRKGVRMGKILLELN
jgi:hypothetical protein